MKPIIQKLWMVVTMLCASISASAYAFNSDGIYYKILSEEDRTVAVTSGNYDYTVNIDIPRKVINNSKTYTVTSIEDKAFYFCESLTSVTIPNSVTSIEQEAFSGCRSLTSVTIGNSVTSIGDQAFDFCSSLTSVTIPNSVTSIGGSAFTDCSSLKYINVDSENANFSSIDGVLYNKDATSLIRCPEAKTSVMIPNSVTSIGELAFSYCDILKTIYMQCEVPIECEPRFSYSVLKESVLYIPTGTKTKYEKVDPWRNFWNIEEMEFSGIDGIEADEYGAPLISVNNGILTINGIGSHESVTVYDMQGRIFYNGTSHTIDKLTPGLYIIKAGSRTIKISI